MKLSIITINYNNCKGLERTLQSILSQTCHDFEWIVIDGGSTDGSRELIEQHQDSMSYWCSEPDKGIYNAMNKGVAKAKGEYCLFLNSGDILCDHNVIEKLNNLSFEADLVSFDMYIDGCSRAKLRKSVESVNAFWIYENTLFHQSTWIRRDVLIKCPYHEEYKTISDWAFFFEAIAVYRCSYQHVPMATSIFYSGGISSKIESHNTDRYDFLKKYFPAKYVEDKEKEFTLHYITNCTTRMTKSGVILMRLSLKMVSFVDCRFFKPLLVILNIFK